MKDILKTINLAELGLRLQNARKSAGLTQQAAADQLQVARTTITAIEKGERPIRPDELIQLAKLYNQSVNRLLQKEIVTESFDVQFRKGLVEIDGSETERAIEAFQTLCEDYLHLEQIMNSPLTKKYSTAYKLSEIDPIWQAEEIANTERMRLGLGDGPLNYLKEMLESEIGLRIFGIPLPSKIAGLFAYTEKLGGCIASNTKHPMDRQNMTIAHEYAHFLTSRYQTDIVVTSPLKRQPPLERFADAFAKFFLMPGSGLQRRFNQIKQAKMNAITPADLLNLADQYAVSFQSLLLRLEELKLIASGTWEKLMLMPRFKVRDAQEIMGLTSKVGSNQLELPSRFKLLATLAYQKEALSEGQLIRILRTDRLQAREIVQKLRSQSIMNNPDDEIPFNFYQLLEPFGGKLKVADGGEDD
ncbi:XRE family transcriptional regulator [candidate division KSB1 bacterium]|nr:XRE family transcriptional regulator [candidate division KSB1 bacterium]